MLKLVIRVLAFILTKNRVLWSKKAVFKNLFLIMKTSFRHESPYHTHSVEVINCAKFDVSSPGSFGVVKTDTRQTYALYIRLKTKKKFLFIFEANHFMYGSGNTDFIGSQYVCKRKNSAHVLTCKM